MEVRITGDPTAAAAVAADLVAGRLRSAVRRRGVATVAFSGGTTPALMLAQLAGDEVPWQQITVFQVDERVAPDGDARRNLGLLAPLIAHGATVAAMPVTDHDLVGGARRYSSLLPERFDVVHLGLGDDGHTASWPPGDPVIRASTAVSMSAPYQGQVRMTVTPRVVNAARCRVVLVTGASKAAPLASWLRGERRLPIARVHRAHTIVVADTEAAALLDAPIRGAG
jgi:6-phosphogluconolactonase/glucosamine-6-phosphate isomerase/deaminase